MWINQLKTHKNPKVHQLGIFTKKTFKKNKKNLKLKKALGLGI